MKLKKLSAVFALLAIVLLLAHVGYNLYSYLSMSRDDTLSTLTVGPFMICACLHGIFAMLAVFLQADGTRADLYPKKNVRTILQRVSAALLFPLIILHSKTFSLIMDAAQTGKLPLFVLLLFAQLLFFAAIFTHVATSFSRALITLGWLSSEKRQKAIDRVVYILCAVLFVGAMYGITSGQIGLYRMMGAA